LRRILLSQNQRKNCKYIERNKLSGRPFSTKPSFKVNGEWQGGGFGIYSAIRQLNEHGGTLYHRVEEGRIITEAVWETW